MPTAKKTPTTQPTGVNTKGNKIALRVFWIVFGVIIGLAAIIWLPGNVKYWIAEAQCGHAPYTIEYSGGLGSAGYYYYAKPSEIIMHSRSIMNKYVCTEQEAIADGYSHDPGALTR